MNKLGNGTKENNNADKEKKQKSLIFFKFYNKVIQLTNHMKKKN